MTEPDTTTSTNDQHHAPVARYPTTREMVATALADPATYTNHEPTPARPNCVLACEDVDGNPRQLIVVALGGRMALANSDGDTTVWTYEAPGTSASPGAATRTCWPPSRTCAPPAGKYFAAKYLRSSRTRTTPRHGRTRKSPALMIHRHSSAPSSS